jgi:hypothetical protein
MATGHFIHFGRQLTNDDDRPSGIPRRGHFGVATSELVVAVIALAILALVGLAFYFSAK